MIIAIKLVNKWLQSQQIKVILSLYLSYALKSTESLNSGHFPTIKFLKMNWSVANTSHLMEIYHLKLDW